MLREINKQKQIIIPLKSNGETGGLLCRGRNCADEFTHGALTTRTPKAAEPSGGAFQAHLATNIASKSSQGIQYNRQRSHETIF